MCMWLHVTFFRIKESGLSFWSTMPWLKAPNIEAEASLTDTFCSRRTYS